MGLYGFLYFALLNTAVPGWIFLAIFLSLIPHAMMYGPQAALIAEGFTPRLRYSGASLGYQLASLIAGGPAPLSPPRCSPAITPATRLRSTSSPARSSAWLRRPCCRTTQIAILPRTTMRSLSLDHPSRSRSRNRGLSLITPGS